MAKKKPAKKTTKKATKKSAKKATKKSAKKATKKSAKKATAKKGTKKVAKKKAAPKAKKITKLAAGAVAGSLLTNTPAYKDSFDSTKSYSDMDDEGDDSTSPATFETLDDDLEGEDDFISDGGSDDPEASDSEDEEGSGEGGGYF